MATTVVCALLALLAQPIVDARRQKQLLNRIAELGGKATLCGTARHAFEPGRALLAIFDTSFNRLSLYALDMSRTKLRDEDLDWLAQIEQVAELNLRDTQVTDTGVGRLARLKCLRKLDVGGTQVTDQGIAQLRSLKNLASLSVVGTQVTYAALAALEAELPLAHFCEERAIEELKAAGIQVDDTPRHFEVGQSTGVGLVRAGSEAAYVVVGMNRPITLTAEDVIGLNQLQSLKGMTFHTVTLDPDGLTALQPLARLKKLSFWVTTLSDRDLEAIARQTQLKQLTISNADAITDDGLSHLQALVNLEQLRISNCRGISAAAINDLADQLPNCKIDYTPHAR